MAFAGGRPDPNAREAQQRVVDRITGLYLPGPLPVPEQAGGRAAERPLERVEQLKVESRQINTSSTSSLREPSRGHCSVLYSLLSVCRLSSGRLAPWPPLHVGADLGAGVATRVGPSRYRVRIVGGLEPARIPYINKRLGSDRTSSGLVADAVSAWGDMGAG
jgi:hypothetical protein